MVILGPTEVKKKIRSSVLHFFTIVSRSGIDQRLNYESLSTVFEFKHISIGLDDNLVAHNFKKKKKLDRKN